MDRCLIDASPLLSQLDVTLQYNGDINPTNITHMTPLQGCGKREAKCRNWRILEMLHFRGGFELVFVAGEGGSSTACLVVLDRRSHRLHTANLGDSGFLVVRAGEVVHRSDEQQHYFNTPFQLSIAPPEAEGVVLSDSPDAADSSSFDVQLGDIILTATDGLFDNMPDYMILQELKKLKNANYESIQQTARSIAEQAHDLAYDPNYMSPFAQFACDYGLNVRVHVMVKPMVSAFTWPH
ncbi:unnamed protein product [Ranitomeya imitator]|uniref:Protein phosphatase n=1 Tax=Ranitomeya imitator TaxID=111125 RepID=A0ABN9KTY9_9NEOB|nr:unnamed protein product [Ranitomeya imitator]